MWSDDGFWVPRAAPGYRFMPPNKRKKSIQNYRLLRHSMIMAHPCWFIKASKCGPQLFGIVCRVAVCSVNCERLSRLIDGKGAKGALQKFLTRSIVFFSSHFPCQATNATQLAIGGNLLLSAEIVAMSFVWISHSVQVNVFIECGIFLLFIEAVPMDIISIIEATFITTTKHRSHSLIQGKVGISSILIACGALDHVSNGKETTENAKFALFAPIRGSPDFTKRGNFC